MFGLMESGTLPDMLSSHIGHANVTAVTVLIGMTRGSLRRFFGRGAVGGERPNHIQILYVIGIMSARASPTLLVFFS